MNHPKGGMETINHATLLLGRKKRGSDHMADYIKTYSGLHMEPTAPKAESIRIEDISHALSLICRGNGHVKTFFSVGQHCIRCALEAEARGYSKRLILACLLHDASEAYMSDITRPLKQYLPQYKAYEKQLLEVIYEKYLQKPLDLEEEKMVKKIDDDLLYFDMLYLLEENIKESPPQLKIQFNYEFVPFELVEKEYLKLFHKFS